MLKDNHLLNYKKNSNFNLIDAIKKFKIKNPKIPVQIEVDNIKQIPIALESKADVILLDNFSKRNLVNALELIDKKVYTEASGGVKLKDLSFLKTLNLDFISTGAPIHQSMWADIGLDFL